MTPDLEDLVLQLFELVNEKNELFRRQAELMYLYVWFLFQPNDSTLNCMKILEFYRSVSLVADISEF